MKIFLNFLIFFLFFLIYCYCDVYRLTKEESLHIGEKYKPYNSLITLFNSFKERNQLVLSLKKNNYELHHLSIQKYCQQRNKQQEIQELEENNEDYNEEDDEDYYFHPQNYLSINNSCSWLDYYSILEDIREPFSNLYDPGIEKGQDLSKIQKKYKSGGNYQTKCNIIKNPTSDTFLKYVIGSKPVIIKGCLPKEFNPSTWTLKNLQKLLGNTQVVVSATPTSEFDGPEDPLLWNISDKPDKYELIVRPAHLNLLFSEFISLFRNKKAVNSSQFYLEYFPLWTIINRFPSQLTKSQKKSLYNQLPKYPFAEWLSHRYHLLWMGGGRNEFPSSSSSSSSVNHQKQKTKKLKENIDYDPIKYFKSQSSSSSNNKKKFNQVPVSRMHFDRMENLMTVLKGKKTFILYDPLQSDNLYGSIPMIGASYDAEIVKNFKINDGFKVKFIRNSSKISKEPNNYHTYSPINVRSPNFKKYPKLKNAKGMICEVEEGDTIYVPSHWWHEVLSFPDDEGKSIGINSFFHPYYHREGFNTSSPIFQKNRNYLPIDNKQTTHVCSNRNIHNNKKIKIEECYVMSSNERFRLNQQNIRINKNNNKKNSKNKERKQRKQSGRQIKDEL